MQSTQCHCVKTLTWSNPKVVIQNAFDAPLHNVYVQLFKLFAVMAYSNAFLLMEKKQNKTHVRKNVHTPFTACEIMLAALFQ